VCPIHAKYDATVHIELCRRLYGRLFTLVAQACAHRLEVDADGLVSRVVYRKWEQEGADLKYHDYTATGTVFVGAAHAIETPKLLLASRSERLPRGVANSSGLVGKYLMDHNTQLSYAVAADPVFGYRGPLSTSGIETLKDNPQRDRAGAFRIEIGNDGWEWPDDAPYQTVFDLVNGLVGDGAVDPGGGRLRLHPTGGLFGERLRRAVREISIRQIRLAALVEPTPTLAHYVEVSPHLDALGLPRPKVEYGISDDPYCIRGMENAIKVHQKIFELLGAVPGQIHHKPVAQFAGAGHIMGTYRMGTDPAQSVTDRHQRSWDHENLFLVGSGLFPTVGASNPTFTIGALSLWAAETIRKQLG
jgi:choline dehydrogenase-like flavoprotein